jgi:aldehyde:ferredoxin oxidoreductase
VGKILEIDLGSRRTRQLSTSDYGEAYIGGRGMAARVAWDQLAPNVDAFDPENRLIFMTGPLTGTLAPTSGRMEVCGASPQAYPATHYTRSNMGGYWGSQLKYAGYDGVIMLGRAQEPVYLWIDDHQVEIRDARGLWGKDTFETQEALCRQHGRGTRTACIGPAGENLVRMAIIFTEIKSAAGQGGFGAVMGSKNLKAIAVRGSGEVAIARPREFAEACVQVTRIAQTTRNWTPNLERKSCTTACPLLNCGIDVRKDVYGAVIGRSYRGGLHCVSREVMDHLRPWETAFEATQLADRMGLNNYDVFIGLGPYLSSWIEGLVESEVISWSDLDIPLDPEHGFQSGEFWSRLILKIAYREGIGDILAEGIPRAADILGGGSEISPHVSHGFTAHWEGRLSKEPPFPYWIVTALNWATDSRDPNGSHAAVQQIGNWLREREGAGAVRELKAIGRRIYGSEKAVDPESGYEWKAEPTIWHENNDCVKDSLPMCDLRFPVIFDHASADGYGDTAADALLFMTATGIDWDEHRLRRAGERIFNLERCIHVREGRRRMDDEKVIPYFSKPDQQGVCLDEEAFRLLMDEFYELRGWDRATGVPRADKLVELGLGFAVQSLAVG